MHKKNVGFVVVQMSSNGVFARVSNAINVKIVKLIIHGQIKGFSNQIVLFGFENGLSVNRPSVSYL